MFIIIFDINNNIKNILNVYLLIPFYLWMLKITPEGLLQIMRYANPAISDVGWSYGLLAVAPFNAIKDAIIIVLTCIIFQEYCSI